MFKSRRFLNIPKSFHQANQNLKALKRAPNRNKALKQCVDVRRWCRHVSKQSELCLLQVKGHLKQFACQVGSSVWVQRQEPKHKINKFHVFIKCHFWFYLLFYSLFLLDPLQLIAATWQRHSNREGRQQAAGQILQLHKLISKAERPDFLFITSVRSQETEGAAQDPDVTEEAVSCWFTVKKITLMLSFVVDLLFAPTGVQQVGPDCTGDQWAAARGRSSTPYRYGHPTGFW